ncbi:MAG: 3-deoxy-D-manno-octulosonic acid transferase, partial [Acidobacteriota bacterium]|nr:3-deoxy-D-manno-octulosonic acid transferase [Acidobacteriota bacterium]
INPQHARSIWIHAVSVGEVLAARALLQDLRRRYPGHRLLLSTTTATGQQVARQLEEAVDGLFYAPLDFSPIVSRALDRVAPDLVIFVDTEIWPNWLRACRRRGVKTVLVNGRISDGSLRGYRLGRRFMGRVLADVDHVCAQTESWGRRFVELGLPSERLTVTGSLKFDALDVASTGAELHVGDRALRYFRFATERPVLIAASTLRGEEEPVLQAFRRIRETAADALLILAPRHPERADEVQRLARQHGFEVTLRTALSVDAAHPTDVVILDTIGELSRLFRLATLVFVGGSLVPAGGHNILEPAVFGKAIVFGPYMDNFREIASLFIDRGAAVQVAS